MRKKFTYLVVWGWSVASWLLPFRAEADFIIEFTDGRRVTVGRYFEEGTMIKIYTLQGSIGFSKAEVKRILSVGANGEGVPLETISLHRSVETESSASPLPPGRKNPIAERDSAMRKTGEQAVGKEENIDREKLNGEYQAVAQTLRSVWNKHTEDVKNGAPLEVLEENRKQMNELNLKRHEFIKTVRQGDKEDLPEWAQ